MTTENLAIAYTVTPEEQLSEVEWMKLIRAGSASINYSALDKARFMNDQYRVGNDLNPIYKKIIELYW